MPAAGGVLVALNYRLNAHDIGFILEHSGARFLFVDHEFEHLAEGAHVERAVRIDDTGTPEDPYEAFLADGSAESVTSELGDEDEPISINYTSGTTGTPKGAVYHYRGAYLNALGEVIETRLTPGERVLVDPSRCSTAMAGKLHLGGHRGRSVATFACSARWSPGVSGELIDGEGVTHYSGAPTVQASILDHKSAHKLDHEIITTVSGSPPTPSCSPV